MSTGKTNIRSGTDPDEQNRRLRAALKLVAERCPIEVLSNYENVSKNDLVTSSIVCSMKRVSLERYLADKIQCIAERSEARDLVDICAVLRIHPEMRSSARMAVGQQDALLLVERLLGWTDREIELDLAAYPDVDPADAKEARQLLLTWLKSDNSDQELAP